MESVLNDVEQIQKTSIEGVQDESTKYVLVSLCFFLNQQTIFFKSFFIYFNTKILENV